MDKARDLCAQYLGGAWKDIDIQQFSLRKLSGGLTNLVFCCELSPDVAIVANEPRSVLLRIQTQSDSLQLMREIAVFMNLSANGYGPKLLAIFPGGRIEEFIPSRNPRKEEYISERYLPTIATLLAKVNNIEMPLPKSPQYVPILRSWLERCYKNGAQAIHLKRAAIRDDVKFPEMVTMDDIEKEFLEIQKVLRDQKSPSVFCHNDMVPSNVLLRDPTGNGSGEQCAVECNQIVLIDYEFGFYNYRGIEIANTVAEFGMTYGVEEHPHYTVDLKLMEDEGLAQTFCGAYLDQLYKDHDSEEKLKIHQLTGDWDEDLKTLLLEARRFLPIQHFFWAIWNIICVQELGDSILDMDFSAHLKERLIMYYHFKANMYKF